MDFTGGQVLEAGNNPQAVTVADFDADGNDDLAVANLFSSDISVRLGNGDGTFSAPQSYLVGIVGGTAHRPYDVATDDFNADGVTDLVTANFQDSTFSILLGNGDGTFGTAQRFDVSNSPISVETGDFDGDGSVDVALGSPGNELVVHLNNGDGTFASDLAYELHGGVLHALTADDFDGDDILDLAVADRSGDAVLLLLGNGDGTFNFSYADSTQSYATGSFPFGVSADDFDGDGVPDLAVANWDSHDVSILLGNGDGTFGLAEDFAVGTSPRSLTTSDFDGDGIRDLVVGADGGVSILLGAGDGTFNLPKHFATGHDFGALGNGAVSVGDFDGDGSNDVVVANGRADNVAVLLNNGDGTFDAAEKLFSGNRFGHKDVTHADFNADGNNDVAVNGFGSDRVAVLLGHGNGSFSAPHRFPVGDSPNSVTAADFDSDGLPDLAVANRRSDDVSILLGNGDGTFGAAQSFASGDGPRSITSGNFNSDAFPDLAVANASSDDVSVLFGNGDGTFAAAQTLSTGDFPRAVTSGRFNDDEFADLAVANAFSDDVSILLSNGGDGTFNMAQNIAVKERPAGITSDDYDGDGLADLAVAQAGSDLVSIRLGSGNGTFGTAYEFAAGNGGSITSTDFDGNGLPDLGVTDVTGMAIFLNQTIALPLEHVPFTEHEIDNNFDGAQEVYATDVDGDGDMDTLGAAYFGDQITWWENTAGDGSTWNENTVDANFDGPTEVKVADVDGDGDADILGTAWADNEIAWWENAAGDATTWTKHVVDNTFSNAANVLGADVDGDDDVDLLGAASGADEIAWWENTADDGTAWTKQTIDGAFDGAYGIHEADVDGDGDVDVVVGAATNDDEVTWWENTAGDGTAWTERVLDSNFDNPWDVYTADIDNDGDLDVLSAAFEGYEIAWWENLTGDGTSWTRHAIYRGFEGWWKVHATDLDLDEDADILAISTEGLMWWENTAGNGTAWTKHAIDVSIDGAGDVYAEDVDRDGDPDVLFASFRGDEIVWWENEVVRPENLQAVVDSLDTSTETDVQGFADSSDIDAWTDSVEALDPRTDGETVDIVLNLASGTYDGTEVNVPSGYRLIIDAEGETVVFEGASPALTVVSGDVLVRNGVKFTNTTDSASILVTGGNLTVRDSTIEETSGGDHAAIEIAGGIVDLGRTADPGRNTLNVNGAGELIRNITAGDVPALGNTFQIDSATLSDPFVIEDKVHHALDVAGLGLVSFVEGNVNPRAAITDVAPTVVAVGAPVSFSGSFEDVGSIQTHDDLWSATSSSLDVSFSGTVTESLSSGTVSATHSFDTPGVYSITLTVTDSAGGEGAANTVDGVDVTVVVYDPQGGFVTGGGWIESPAGAYTVEPTLSGKASFGFNSKYKKGANAPTGQTEFRFRAGDFRFHSDAYEWLVVAGARAQYKGTGSVNGQNGYGFKLTGIDGQVTGGGGADKFRLKVWDETTGRIIYDNQIGDGDDAQLNTELGGGQVVIHTGKQNLVASSSGSQSRQGTLLSQSRLDEAVAEAIEHWSHAGLRKEEVVRLESISAEIAGLSGSTLGIASESTNKIWLDLDAAGYGWSLDGTARDVDLLSAVSHELGHKLDLDHDVMGGSLAVGARHLVSEHVGAPTAPVRVSFSSQLAASLRRDAVFASLGPSDKDLRVDEEVPSHSGSRELGRGLMLEPMTRRFWHRANPATDALMPPTDSDIHTSRTKVHDHVLSRLDDLMELGVKLRGTS